MSINRVIISGNLTRDAELRNTAGGMSILSFAVAVNDRKKNAQTGEWEDVPNFIGCTMFGTRAEKISTYLLKGTKVAIEGKLRWSQWENKDGEKRTDLKVIVDELELMSKQQGQAQAPQRQQQQPVPEQEQFEQPAQQSIYDEDIPF